MKPLPRLGGYALALALFVAGVSVYGWQQRKVGRAQAAEAEARRQLDSLAVVARAVDTVYQVRVDTFRVYRTRLDTFTVTVEQWKRDTLEVVRYVARADSTIRACELALETCDERDAVRVQQLAAWQRRWDARPKPRSAFWTWAERFGWLGVVVLK